MGMKRQNQAMKMSGGVRALSIILGILTLIFAFAIVAFPELGLFTIVIWTAITLISVGLGRIAIGLGVPNLSSGLKAFNIIAGLLAVIIAFVALYYPDLTLAVQIILFGLSLLINGITQLTVAGLGKQYPISKWVMALIGILSIIFGIVVMAFPGFGTAVLVVFVALGLLMQGIDSISIGVSGQ